MKRYQAILYDIDGTLLSTLEMNFYPLVRIIKEETGQDWTYEQALQFAAIPGLKTMELLGVKDIEKTYARWVSYVNSYEKGAEEYDGIRSVLAAFHAAGIPQAVVSAKMRKQYEIDMVSKGLDDYINVTVLADDTKKHKPDPEPLRMCLTKLGLSSRQAIYIGDMPTDYQAAKNAGMDFGYAKWGSLSGEGIDQPAFVFEKPEDMLVLLEDES